MTSTIKVRSKLKGKSAIIKLIIKHPMTVDKLDKNTGKVIPAHFIDKVNVLHNGKQIIHANWGQAVSTNPFVTFTLKEANKGDQMVINWSDNKGKTDSLEITI